MSLLEILLIALGVSVDAFAVSVGGAMGCSRSSWRNGLNAGIFFGGFQFLMPVAGFFAASALTGFVEKYDHWCAFGLLVFVGAKMVWDGIHDGEKKEGGNSRSMPAGFLFPEKTFPPRHRHQSGRPCGGGLHRFFRELPLAPCRRHGHCDRDHLLSGGGVGLQTEIIRVQKDHDRHRRRCHHPYRVPHPCGASLLIWLRIIHLKSLPCPPTGVWI